MQFNYYFEFCSLLFVFPFFILAVSKKSLPNLQNNLYNLLTVFSTLNIVFSLLGIFSLRVSFVGSWVQYISNGLFVLSQCISLFLLFGYVKAVTGCKSINAKSMVFYMLPAIITSILILTTRFTHLIFYIENGKYTHGKLHFVLYFNALFYMLGAYLLLLLKRKQTELKNRNTIFLFLVLLTAAVILQFFNPQFLFLNSVAVLGLILVYIFLQAPSHFVDRSTGLFNHNTLVAITNGFYDKAKPFNFVVLCLEEYKSICNLFGTKNCTDLVVQIGQYLTQIFGKKNVLRLSADEFGIYCFNKIDDANDLSNFVTGIPKHWSIGSTDIKINFNAVCLNSINYNCTEMFLTNADFAMSHARQLNNAVFMFDRKAGEEFKYRFKVESVLKKAIEKESIDVYFQPIYNAQKGSYTALEALARLYDENLGFISPTVFIRIAEQNGLITRLGEIILEKVCCFIKLNNLKQLGIEKIDVNLSVAQCIQSNLSLKVANILNKYAIDGSCICFEVTETAATTSFSSLKQNMEEISNLGISFALDDYGMGYSSLNYLMRLPFSYLKIDKELLWSAAVKQRNEVLFECILYMAKRMDLAVVSEGAETEAHLEFLNKKGVTLIQGFYYARPMSQTDTIAFLNKGKI